MRRDCHLQPDLSEDKCRFSRTQNSHQDTEPDTPGFPGWLGGVRCCFNYKNADTAYSDLISKNSAATTELFRANTSLVALGYDTTLGLLQAEQGRKPAEIQDDYKKDVGALFARLEAAPKLLPEINSSLSGITDRARAIVKATDEVWVMMKNGDFLTARRKLTDVNAQIADWRADIRR